MSADWSIIADHISQKLDEEITFQAPQSIGGGCINQTWKVTDQRGRNWFVKTNKPFRVEMFNAEMQGLEAILTTQSIRTPKPICFGQSKQHSFLVLEYLELGGSPNPTLTGAQLAHMHQHTWETFGWTRDNTIGSTAQINTPKNNWISFWQEHRLGFQLKLALQKGLSHQTYDAGMELSSLMDQFFTDYHPSPSLLHGDLWGGNCSVDISGNPVIYDPAVYFGDRETDLAMTELFGGFGNRFMSSYDEHYPIDVGYPTRKTLYNLYHIMNHYNLFGGSYSSQADSMIHSLLSVVR